MLFPKRRTKSEALEVPRRTETHQFAMVSGPEPIAQRRAQLICTDMPGPTAHYPPCYAGTNVTLSLPAWFRVIRVPVIGTPFPNIANHVVETEFIRRMSPGFGRGLVWAIRTVGPFSLPVRPPRIGGRGLGASRIFPLGLGWQTIDLSRLVA